MFGAGGSWVFSARRWFTGPVINLSNEDAEKTELEKDKTMFNTTLNDEEGATNKQETKDVATTDHKEKIKNNNGVEVSEIEKVNE